MGTDAVAAGTAVVVTESLHAFGGLARHRVGTMGAHEFVRELA